MVSWTFVGILVAIGFLLFAIFRKSYKGGFNLGSFKPLKRKVLAFATPKRVELILISLYFIFFLWWDVVQNQVLSYGLVHRVTWFGGITSNAVDLAVVLLIAFHLILMSLFLFSLKSKRTHNFYDIIVGTLAFFGVAIVLSGFLWGLKSDVIRFLFVDMQTISFYHIGVGIEILAGLYWCLTD